MAVARQLQVKVGQEREGNGGLAPGFDPAAHWRERLRDGTEVLIRPITKDDGVLERAFIERLSPQSKQNRFHGQYRIDDAVIRRFTDIDYRRDMAFIALLDAADGEREIGVCRFCISEDNQSCECAVAVSDEWQGKGLGTLLMRHLIAIARQRGIKRMISIELSGNRAMHDLAESLGFKRDVDHRYSGETIHKLDL